MKKIAFTGGGSSGHVTPNLALIEYFQQQGWDCQYFGTEDGIEHQLVAKKNIPFHGIQSGKLRRYFSWQNFIDPFKLLIGLAQAWVKLGKYQPDVVFSKGGFVAVPVVVAAKLRGIPIVCHESDFTPGLANKISYPFVNKVCVTFEDTIKKLKHSEKAVYTGTPIRSEFFKADAQKGRDYCGFNTEKPILLVTGGGQGAQKINEALRTKLPELLQQFQIIHLCGHGKVDESLNNTPGYKQFDYVHDELFDLFACADMIVSRSGANALYEIIATQKVHLLIPLGLDASRGDQIVNARYFEKLGLSHVLPQPDMTPETLVSALTLLLQDKDKLQKALNEYQCPNGTEQVSRVIIGQTD